MAAQVDFGIAEDVDIMEAHVTIAYDKPIVDGKSYAEVALQTCSGNYHHIGRYFVINSLVIRYKIYFKNELETTKLYR